MNTNIKYFHRGRLFGVLISLRLISHRESLFQLKSSIYRSSLQRKTTRRFKIALKILRKGVWMGFQHNTFFMNFINKLVWARRLLAQPVCKMRKRGRVGLPKESSISFSTLYFWLFSVSCDFLQADPISDARGKICDQVAYKVTDAISSRKIGYS